VDRATGQVLGRNRRTRADSRSAYHQWWIGGGFHPARPQWPVFPAERRRRPPLPYYAGPSGGADKALADSVSEAL